MKKILIALLLCALCLPLSPSYAQDAVSKETRAVWVSRWQYTTESDIRKIIQEIDSNNFNTVFFQVRGQGDAYYKSSYEPWAKTLTGTLGKDPGFDPLAVAIDEAHKHGMELHAWLNMMPMWRGDAKEEDKSVRPLPLYLSHPEWVLRDTTDTPMPMGEGYIFMDAMQPGVISYLRDLVKEIADNYDIDGLHMDYIRYPNPSLGKDSRNMERYTKEARKHVDIDSYRRFRLNLLVSSIKLAVRSSIHKPELSAAVIGYHIDEWGWGYEQGGAYRKYLQDSKEWLSRKRVDFIAPMVYWPIGGKPDFMVLLQDYAKLAKGRIVIGMSTTNTDAEETWKQINAVKNEGGFKGFSLFSFTSNDALWSTYKESIQSWE